MLPQNWKTRQALLSNRCALLAQQLTTATGATRRQLQRELTADAERLADLSSAIAKRTAAGAVLLIATACAAPAPQSIDAQHQRALDTLLAELHAAGKISGNWSAQP